MEKLPQRFLKNWAKQGFGRNDGIFLLALSGGIDSMVLANLLLEAKIPFAVAHCNFSLRGMDSDGDAAFVKVWCDERKITCHVRVFDTKKIAEEKKESTQLAARNLRYAWFDELCSEHKYAGILTAHHADDVAETVLINLCRGTGIAGLHGIRAKYGKVLRPLLFACRKEIAAFAESQNIAWREDASNAKTDYLRNAFRHEILPRIESILPGAAQRIAETAQRVAETEIIYRASLEKLLTRLVQARGRDFYMPINLLKKQAALQTLAFEIFSKFSYSPEQIPEILKLMNSESGSRIMSSSHRVFRHRDFLVVTTNAAPAADLMVIDSVPSIMETNLGQFVFTLEDDHKKPFEDGNIACFDADKITFPLVLRTRREGDYFYPFGMGMKKKKLKKFLIDRKLGVHEKESIRILESDKKILWVVGQRIDERFKVTVNTDKVLKVVFKPI
ncbi:MAG: tRNA lysidine(34) synthetase TilS [Chitinophagaceae bacterium]